MAGSSLPPGALNPADANPSLNVLGDTAETSLPAYLITFTDAGGTEHTCRASAQEQYPRVNPTAHAVAYRRPFLYSMAVLAAMLAALVAAVIAILHIRDSDPQ
jgi:hypothetical protein